MKVKIGSLAKRNPQAYVNHDPWDAFPFEEDCQHYWVEWACIIAGLGALAYLFFA